MLEQNLSERIKQLKKNRCTQPCRLLWQLV